ncbi:TonB-dependent receptor [Sediminitomix flava]|uniref:Outer membrane receptor protein involved in Fe transport n=1 Tax=Sediminitomix flava TaxID=379075 RepID=A0A315Z867_SEDFL|nr:TonB-dependent receptor [Sediminitomix flava]PWJ41776.1 outer membrane receptor protein involved in Fe transport [Sediminitomix flava]
MFNHSSIRFTQNNTSIRGVIKNTEGNPLPFSHIVIKGTNNGVYTKDDGSFTIQNVQSGVIELIVNHVGHKTVHKTLKLSPNSVSNLLIKLEEEDQKLDVVTIYGEAESTKMEKEGFSSTSINTEKLKIQSVELNDILDQTSGINVRNEGGLGSRSRYSINGLGGNSVRFFIDGIPMEYYGASYSLNSIPVSLIEEMQVYKGVVPVNLGADALGGAVNIKTKKVGFNSLDVSYSIGSFNTHQIALNGNYRNQKNGLTFRGAVFYNYSDNNYTVWGDDVYVVDPNTGRIDRSIKAKRFNDAFESLGTKLDFGFTDVKWADQLMISFLYSDMYKEVQHGATMSVPFGERYYTQGNIVPSVHYKKSDFLTEGFELDLFTSYAINSRTLVDSTTNKYNWHGDIWAQNPNGGEAGTPLHSTTDEGSLINRFNASYNINEQNKINFNLIHTDYKRTAFNRKAPIGQDTSNNYTKMSKNLMGLSYSNSSFDDRLRTNVFGKFYKYSVNMLDHEFINGEYYPVYHSTTDNNYGYGLAIGYDISKNITVQLSSEQAVRLPEPDELFGNFSENIHSAIDLKPELSKNINLGLRFGNYLWNEHSMMFSTTLFYRSVSNMIQQSTQVVDGIDVFVNENFGEIISKGIDFQIEYDYKRQLEATLAGAYNDTRYMSLYDIYGRKNMYYGSRLKNEPFLQFNSSIRYKFSRKWIKKGELSMSWNMRYVYDYFRHWENIGSDNKDIIPSQWVNDLGVSYRLPNNKFALSLDLKNIFNVQVFDNFAIQQPGIGLYFKVNYAIF